MICTAVAILLVGGIAAIPVVGVVATGVRLAVTPRTHRPLPRFAPRWLKEWNGDNDFVEIEVPAEK